MKTYEELLVSIYSKPKETSLGLAVGDDYGTKLIQSEDLKIVSKDEELKLPDRHVAQSLETFIQTLEIFIGSNKEDINKLKKQFEEIDHTIFNHEENWWSVIFEQLEYESE